MIDRTEQQADTVAHSEPLRLVMTLEEVQSHLGEIIDKLAPGEEVVLTRGDKHVARIVAGPIEKPRPVLGRGKGMLTVIAEDDDHLKDFTEYMP